MNGLSTLTFGEKPVRMAGTPDNPMFCLADACRILGIKNSRDFLKSPWCMGDGVDRIYTVDSLGKRNRLTFINEPNLYALVLRSDKPEALAFHRWIVSEVLPSIRKTGGYQAAPVAPEIQDSGAILRTSPVDSRVMMRECDEMFEEIGRLTGRGAGSARNEVYTWLEHEAGFNLSACCRASGKSGKETIARMGYLPHMHKGCKLLLQYEQRRRVRQQVTYIFVDE